MSMPYIPDILKYLISLTHPSFMTVCTFYRFLNFQIQISQNSKKFSYALLPINPRYVQNIRKYIWNLHVSYVTAYTWHMRPIHFVVYVTCMFHIFCHILCIYEMFQFNIYTIYDIYVLSYYLDGDIYVADICNSIYSGIYVTPHIYAKIYDFFICHIYFVPYGYLTRGGQKSKIWKSRIIWKGQSGIGMILVRWSWLSHQ